MVEITKQTPSTRTKTTIILLSGLVLLGAIALEISHSPTILLHWQQQYERTLEQLVDRHKDLFPLNNSDYVGTFLIGIGLMIAASGGVGGGGILVPLLIIVYEFHPKYAIPLSNFTILGSSITNMVLNIPKRHPDTERPLVDWDLILVMEPLTMAGAVRTSLISPSTVTFFSSHILCFFFPFLPYLVRFCGCTDYWCIGRKSITRLVVGDFVGTLIGTYHLYYIDQSQTTI